MGYALTKFEQSDVLNKNEFLKSFTSRKLRKNSKNKIAKLLAIADTVTLKTQSMGMDDCYSYNEPSQMGKSDFYAWYENNYQKMVIDLSVIDGVLTRVTFSDCPFHFSDDVVMTFSLEAENTMDESSKVETPMTNAEQEVESLDIVPCRKIASLGDYQARITEKKDRLEARAEKAQEESNARFETAHQLGHVLPFGQPILVGHHSEGKHRRLIKNIDNNMRKSVESQGKADYLASKASSVGTAGIASDDPEAITKLKEKLANLQRSQEVMKAVNKLIRSKGMTKEEKIAQMIQTHKLTEKQASDLFEGDFCGRVGFPQYALQNNSATIRATKLRIQELEQVHNSEPLNDSGEIEGIEWKLYEEEGRIKFSFDGVPSETIRKQLKSNGFKWSRYSMAWVRKITANALRATKWIVEDLKKM